MGLITGKMSGRRFRSVFPVAEGWRGQVKVALEKHAFVERKIDAKNKEVTGLCRIDNAYDVKFDDMGWLVDPYVFFAFRIDKKKIDKKRLKRDLEEACRVWLEGRGLEKMPSSVKRQLKAELEDAAYQSAPIHTKTVDVVWNTVEGYILVGSTSEADCDAVRKILRRGFGITLVHDSPGVQEEVFAEDGGDLPEGGLDARVGFLDYLVYSMLSGKEEVDTIVTKSKMSVFCGSDIVFLDEVKKEKISVSSSAALSSKESLQAMLACRPVHRISIEMRKGDEGWAFGLEADPSVFRGVAVPIAINAEEKTDLWRSRFERYEEGFEALSEVGKKWLALVEEGTFNEEIRSKTATLVKVRL